MSLTMNGNNTNRPKTDIAEPVSILMVEDSMSDALLLRMSLDKTELPYHIDYVTKGSAVLPTLATQSKEGEQHLPEIIFLDLSLPGMSGFDILEELSTGPKNIRSIPIAIMTNLRDFQYIAVNYDLCIAGYFEKPCDPESLKNILSKVIRFRPKN